MKAFLSHTSSDKPFVLKLARDLKSENVDVWLDEWEIRVGNSIVEEIDKALSSHGFFVLILSSRSLQSDWVRKELNSSLMRYLSDRTIKILPVLYERCNVPTIISDLRYADFTSDYGKGFADLCAGLGLISSSNWRHVDHRQVEMTTYHEMIRRLVGARGYDVFLNEQLAMIYDLRNFPEYYDHTVRQLRLLREHWSSNEALIGEIDETISYIERQKQT